MCVSLFVCVVEFLSLSSGFGEDWRGNFPLKSLNISLALKDISHPSPVNISCPEFAVRCSLVAGNRECHH